MKKRIVLCADDYGQAPAISQGILDLVKKGRLSAVSCLTTTPYWREHAAWLKPYQSQIDIGLHINLTENKTPLPRLIGQALLRRLDKQALEVELNQQIEAFYEAMGFLPRFLDGHHHVHQLPVVRDAMLSVYEQRLKGESAYIRVVNPKITAPDRVKKMIIYSLGSRTLMRELSSRNIQYNQSFSGIYGFGRAGDYAALFPAFLSEIEGSGIVMCHPGLPSSLPNDPIAAARYLEYQYLAGIKLNIDCDANQCEISRFHP